MLSGWLCLALTGSMAAAENAATEGTSRLPDAGSEAAAEGDPELARAVSATLEAALGEDGDLADLHLVVGCLEGDSFRTLEIFGRGIGIWNDEAQFSLDSDSLREVLRAVRSADFAHMQRSYGGRHDPAPSAPETGSAIKIICDLRLSLGGVEKGVFQLFGGRQHQPLWDLARGLFAAHAEAAAAGIRAADLADGLRKLAVGELAPETFRVILNRPAQPSSDALSEKESGPKYLLQLEGRIARSRPYGADGGLGEESESSLTVAELIDLAAVLADSHVEDLPSSLFAPTYVDLTVKVLGYEKSVQARRFAGMDRETHGDAQLRFEKVAATVDALYGRLAAPVR